MKRNLSSLNSMISNLNDNLQVEMTSSFSRVEESNKDKRRKLMI